jgi:hypothetical protein
MKFSALAAIMALGLAGCGGGGGADRAALIKACQDEGSMEDGACDCMADSAKDELSPKLYKMLVDAAKSGGSPEDTMNDLSPEDQGEFMGFAMKAAMSCGVM